MPARADPSAGGPDVVAFVFGGSLFGLLGAGFVALGLKYLAWLEYYALGCFALAFLIATAGAALWFRQGRLARVLLGADIPTLRQLRQEYEDETIWLRGRGLVPLVYGWMLRAGVVAAVAVLVGQAVLALNAALLAKQNMLLDRQNQIQSKSGLYESFFALHHGREPAERFTAFLKLLDLKQGNYAGAHLSPPLPSTANPGMIKIMPGRRQKHGVFGEPEVVTLPWSGTYNFIGARLENVIIILGKANTHVVLDQVQALNFGVLAQAERQSVSFRGANLEHVALAGRFVECDFSDARLDYCHLKHEWDKATFVRTRLSATGFAEKPLEGNAARSNAGTDRLSKATELTDIAGLTDDELETLARLNPALMAWRKR